MNLPIVLIYQALRSLFLFKFRSFLTLLGIVIGTSVVIALVSIGQATKQQIRKQFQAQGAEVITVGFNSIKKIQPQQLGQLKETLSSEFWQINTVLTNSAESVFKGKSEYAEIAAISDGLYDIAGLEIDFGNKVYKANSTRIVGVIGREVYESYKRQGVLIKIGDIISVNSVNIYVAGVLKYWKQSAMTNIRLNSSILVSEIAYQRLGFPVKNGEILLIANTKQSAIQSKQYIQQVLDESILQNNYHIKSPEKLIANIEYQNKTLNLMLGVIAALSLVVGGIGVMNIMLVTVSERRKEIGLRMAIGASTFDIKMQFLIEALVLCVLGGIFGCLLGVSFAYGYAYYTQAEFYLSLFGMFLGVVISMLVGVFFGFFPAVQASKMDPAEALSGE